MIDLSIIIVTYNPGAMVMDCLRSVAQTTRNLSHEVIVIDNASQDGTPKRISQGSPEIRLIANEDNRGFAAAVNQGLAISAGCCLLLLNPDVIVHADALAIMVTYLKENPTVGIVGPRTFDGKGNVALTARAPYNPLTISWHHLGLSRLLPYHVYGRYRRACQNAEAPFEPSWVQGSCLMLRREVYEQIGGLDEGFFLFAEEADFCDRTARSGWRIAFLPQASITHHESSSVSQYIPIKLRYHHVSPLYYFRKRGREGAILALKLVFTLELLGKSIVRLFQIVWQRDKTLGVRICSYWAVLRETWAY